MKAYLLLRVALVIFATDTITGIDDVSEEEDMALLQRVKRSGHGSSNLTAFLTKDYEWETVSDIIISNKIPFHYTIVIPEGPHTLKTSINSTLVNDENIFSLCSVYITKFGENIATDMITNVTFIQTTGTQGQSYKIHSAEIDFGTVTNTGNQTDLSGNEIEVTLEFVVVNSSAYTTNSNYYVEARAEMDGGSESWTEQIGFTAKDSSNLWSAVPPLFNISGPTTVTIGGVVNWTVTANLRDAVNRLHVEAWVNGTVTYPACNIYLADIGFNYECLDPNSIIATKSSERARFEIPTAINTGFNDNITTSAEDNIILNILTKVPSFVNTTAALDLNIEVYLDDKLAWSAWEGIQLVSGSLPTTNSSASLQVDALGGITTVAKGSGIIFTIDVTTGPGSVTPYTITAETDTGLAIISSITVISAGDNLCMRDYLDVTFSSTDATSNMNKVVAVTDSVANTLTQAGNNVTANQFRVEVVVCVPENSTAAVGATLGLAVDVLYEDIMTFSDSAIFTVTSTVDPALATGSANLANGTTPVGSIASVVTVSQLAEISQTTEWFNLTVDVPVIGGSALATLIDVGVVFAGDNFACLPYNPSEVSTVVISHTQVIQATYALGYIVSTGTSDRSLFQNPSPTDNTIEFEISLQVLDHYMNTMNSYVNVMTTLIGSSGFTTSGVSLAEVIVSGIEKPELIFDVNMDPFSIQKVSGDNITFNVNIYHDIYSTAHAQNVIVYCMTPHYIELGEILSSIDANITVQSSTPEYGIQFEISEIDFNDNVSFSFSALLDPGRVMPVDVVDLETVVPVDMTYRGPVRGDRVDTGMLHSDVTVLTFTFDTENAGVIGLAYGLIQDCQITASSWLDTNPASDARLNTGLGWKPMVRGAPFCGEEHIQINMGVVSQLAGVRIQSSVDDYTDIPTSFTVLYSQDGLNWVYIYASDSVTPKNFSIDVTSGSSVNDIYDFDLTPRLTTQYIRLVPRSASCLIGLRLELVGLLGTGPPVYCNTTTNDTDSQLAERSYIVNTGTGTIFVCGPESLDGPIYCSRSDEAGDAWYGVDDTVANVIGAITNTTTVIGLSHDGHSHVISFDDGITWEVLSVAELTSYQTQPGYLTTVVFPDEDMRSQSFDSIYSLYGMDGNDFFLTGCVDGIAVKRSGGSWQTKAWWGTQEASTMA